jgi:molybdopterin/thiamine biosynthesis adenylyltransferase
MRYYSPDTEVVAVCQRITDAASIVGLAGDADVVVHAIDTPDDIQLIVNEACFTLGVPMVLGGLQYSTLGYWSVQPGVSPCRRCLDLKHRDEEPTLPDAVRTDPIINMQKVNRATGPVVQLAGGFVSLEVMRYLVGTEPPVAAATYHVMELTGGMTTERTPWPYHPECELCLPKS